MNILYVLPQRKGLVYTAGQTILQILQYHHLIIDSPCGGNGTCGKCIVTIISGTVNSLTEEEQRFTLLPQQRLSCCVYPQGEVTVCLPNMTDANITSSPHYLPTQTSSKDIDMKYGFAIDIGTTTVVMTLINLTTKKICHTYTHLNAQRAYGADVLSRIAFATKEPTGLTQLQKAVIRTITDGVLSLCRQYGLLPQQIQQYVISANTTMLHLLLHVPVATLGKAPYTPIFTSKQLVLAATLGLPGSVSTTVYCLPSVSTFIGADIVSGAVMAGLPHTKETVLFLDMGTNCEIILATPRKMLACSCAAGPALEGANISYGMTATTGAIDDVSLDAAGNLCISTIGHTTPHGLCGSGILALTALFCQTGIISPRGRFRTRKEIIESKYPQLGHHLLEDGKKRYFRLAPHEGTPYITQQDIRQIQLAKGAIAAGLHLLLLTAQMEPCQIDRIIIAGQFGQHMNVQHIIQIGLMPPEWQPKITYIGNSSRLGAVQSLLHPSLRQEMEETAKKIQYIDLAQHPAYERLFIKEMQFPEAIP